MKTATDNTNMTGIEFFEMLATTPGATAIHPQLATAFRDYLRDEKAVRFGEQWVVNTHLPPFPGRAFDAMIGQMIQTDNCRDSATQHVATRRLFSVTLAVTNRCRFGCAHCYNAGRSQRDLSVKSLKKIASELQTHGAVTVTLTGGEPLLRDDLEELCHAFDDRTSLIIGTTGHGLTPQRARALRQAGVFGMGISLDSADMREHDRMRGFDGAQRIALDALCMAADAGLYPYVVSVATREFLDPVRFYPFLEFAKNAGAREVHLLEPCPVGRLAGHDDVTLTAAERMRLLDYQREFANRTDMPVLSTFAHLESPDAFGCGAGITHIYIDGAGALSPCNLVPLSFGNIADDPLDTCLERMARHFRQPRTECIGRCLAAQIPRAAALPLSPKDSDALCERCLPREHALPRFFDIRRKTQTDDARELLADAYDRIHEDYDDFWTVRAGVPARDLVERLDWRGDERVLEAGCGSGVATLPIARRLRHGGHLVAVDVSANMQRLAMQRVTREHLGARVDFVCADALETLHGHRNLDIVFSTWVLGYIPLAPFLRAAADALRPGGRLAFLVHTHNSPRREFSLFAQLAARNPDALTRTVDFGFPRDAAHVRDELLAVGLAPLDIWQDAVIFNYETAEEVLDHLLKSGAGTVFHDAVAPSHRAALTAEFLERLRTDAADFDVRHDYVACVARKEGRQ